MIIGQAKRSCLFCGADLATHRSQEHVFPQWLMDELGITYNRVAAMHFLFDEHAGTKRGTEPVRYLSLNQMKEGRICSDCNNGWMSTLESQVRNCLVDLVRGHKESRSLTVAEKLLVARWAAKTCYMLNSSSNYPIRVPSRHLAELRSSRYRLPQGVSVVASRAPHQEFQWFQSTVWMLVGPDRAADRVSSIVNERTYKIGIQFGKIALITTWNSIPKWTVTMWKEIHEMLCPMDRPCGWDEGDTIRLGSVQPAYYLPGLVDFIYLTYIRWLHRAKTL